jgi:ornithine cyclodeaminase/alanine dehydrogenase-like protein (mu-crystallin family)
MNRSTAAAIAAACSRVGDPLIRATGTTGSLSHRGDNRGVSVALLDSEAVFEAVSAEAAVTAVREAFARHARGEWAMPPKVYVSAPPNGDFRAMPAIGAGLAVVKWVTSFPHNPERGLPVVAGALLVSDSETGSLLAILDCAAVTSLRTGAAAAVSAAALARGDARTVGVIGCGVNGAWAARCLVAAGYDKGVCADARPAVAAALAAELGWRSGERAEAVAQDIVVTVTPGDQPVVFAGDLRPGQHYAVLGADAHGKSEVEAGAFGAMRLFCDEWAQASGGGELAAPAEAGAITREDVTQIGQVLTGEAEGRRSAEEITLFDSTGLAIQDLAIAHAALRAVNSGAVSPDQINL